MIPISLLTLKQTQQFVHFCHCNLAYAVFTSRCPFCNQLLEDTLLLFLEGSNSHLDTMEEMANLHVAQFESPSHSLVNLDKAIKLWCEICCLCVPSGHYHLLALYQLSTLFQQCCFPTCLLQGLIHDRSPNTSNPNCDNLDEAILMQQATLG
jgi:hypothetical protein